MSQPFSKRCFSIVFPHQGLKDFSQVGINILATFWDMETTSCFGVHFFFVFFLCEKNLFPKIS